jgi:DNA-binding beta-propeller fold protein YncE
VTDLLHRSAGPAGAACQVPAGGPYRPLRWLGGTSAMGLALPDASPSPSTMYAPRGVCQLDGRLVVADTGNHRLLVWDEALPGDDHADADHVIGQPDMTSEGPKLLFLPTGMLVGDDGRLIVADAWHHRILVWDDLDAAISGDEPVVLGQPPSAGLDGVEEGCGPQRFYWPFGVAVVDGTFWVADTGNRRVLGWTAGIPEPGQAADAVLGQPDLMSRGENRDDAVAANSMRWPHSIAAAGDVLFVADAGNHRVLGWRGDVSGDRPADVVLGQPDFTTAFESPYRPQGARSFRFPYAVAAAPDGRLFVGDTSNNRIAVFDHPATTTDSEPAGAPCDRVLGQSTIDGNGENRWDRVGHDTFCWPYGMSFRAHDDGGCLAVADSGNNRVTVWSTDR